MPDQKDARYLMGYADASAFNRAFKRLSGVSPLKYRKTHVSKRYYKVGE